MQSRKGNNKPGVAAEALGRQAELLTIIQPGQIDLPPTAAT
jgi:hypothetical protein